MTNIEDEAKDVEICKKLDKISGTIGDIIKHYTYEYATNLLNAQQECKQKFNEDSLDDLKKAFSDQKLDYTDLQKKNHYSITMLEEAKEEAMQHVEEYVKVHKSADIETKFVEFVAKIMKPISQKMSDRIWKSLNHKRKEINENSRTLYPMPETAYDKYNTESYAKKITKARQEQNNKKGMSR